MTAREAVHLITRNLEGAYREPDNPVYRDPMIMASMMAGLAFSNASLGLVHAMAHSLGGRFDLAHGECNALLLEKVVAFNFSAAAEKYGFLADTMGVVRTGGDPETSAREIGQWIGQLRQRLGISARLSDYGVREADLPELARLAAKDPCLSTNPRTASPEQIKAVYQASL